MKEYRVHSKPKKKVDSRDKKKTDTHSSNSASKGKPSSIEKTKPFASKDSFYLRKDSEPRDFSDPEGKSDRSLEITYFSNPKVKYISLLKEKKFREKENRVFIEGFREIQRAYAGFKSQSSILPKFQPEILCISPECFLGKNEWELIKNWKIPVWQFPKAIFEKISHRDRPDGLILLASIPDTKFKKSYLSNLENEIILIIEGVEKPGNLGTIIRTAEGAGVHSIIVTDPQTDIYSPNVVRSSTGILFTLPVFQGNTDEVLQALKGNGFSIKALSPESENMYTKSDLKGKLALVFGSEQYGLSQMAKNSADELLGIPMKGEADSLNLALSVGIVTYEAIRQRNS
ncbi:MAG: rRNA methyltransferase [Leptospira sp.]|nr:MAG: rRNA methyltransferase [Leptospira sp.]